LLALSKEQERGQAVDKMNESPASAARKRLLEQELARFVRLLTAYGDPERVIVFGSLVTGQVWAWSDIDLIIVEQTNLPFMQRLRKMRKLLQPQVGTDILVYTPEEYEQLRRERPFFREEILANGRVVYERGSDSGPRRV
jgi:predicted nucleotidyltransferase